MSARAPDPSRLWNLGFGGLEALRRPYGFSASEADTGLYAALFGRDSLWTLLLMLEALTLRDHPPFAEWVRDAGANIISTLCRLQGSDENDRIEEQPGKIVHEFRQATQGRFVAGLPYEGGRNYSGFDQTFLFVIAYRRFADHFPGDAVVVDGWDNVQRALDWVENYGDEDGDGLFEHRRRNAANLVNQVWKDSFDSVTHAGFDVPPHPLAWIEVQGYAFRALLDAAALYRARGQRVAAQRCARRAEELQRAVDKFWMDGEDCYAIALDGRKLPVTLVASNPVHALWAGVVPKDREDRLIARLMAKDMLTPYGLRTLSADSPLYAPFAYHRGSVWPFDNAVFAAGLLDCGREQDARKVIEPVGRVLQEAGTPLEAYAVLDPAALIEPRLERHALAYHALVSHKGSRVPRNQIQAWTGAALLFFAAALARLQGSKLRD